jgi:hypothetical protein
MATRKKSTFTARPVNARKMMTNSAGSPNARLRSVSRSTGFKPKAGAAGWPSTAKNRSEFDKMFRSATPARQKSLASEFKKLRGKPLPASFPAGPTKLRGGSVSATKKKMTRAAAAKDFQRQRKRVTSNLGTPKKRSTGVRAKTGTARSKAAYYGGGPQSAAYFASTAGGRGKTTAAARKRLNAAKRKRRSTAKKR